MTISTESTRVEHTGDGSTLPFAVPFKFLDKTDLVVVLRTILTGVDAVQTLYTHYTVLGAGDASGTVTFVTAPPGTQKVVIYNDPPLTQLVDYIAGGTFPAETHEEALDRLTIQQKRTREITTRAILLPDADTDGSGAYDAKSNRIKNLGAPIATTDAATKTYTDVLVNNTALGPAPTGLIATGSVTSRLLADRWGEVKNVKDFGATGDGVTNDTVAIQAAVDAGSEVLFPSGNTFRITAEVIVPAGRTLVGTGTILVDQSPYVRALRLGSDTTVDGLTFRGNGTATLIVGGLTGGQQGVAITSYSTHNVKVRNCHFYDFVQGVINTGASLIQFSSGYAFEVSGCYFDVSNDGFVDIGCAYRVGDTIITENVSYSNSDIFYHCSSVGATEKVGTSQVEVTAHHIVTDNILIKNRWEPVAAGRAPGRHGITVHYDGGTSHLTATGNVIGNTTRHGFYLRGLNDGTSTNPAGPNTIANNRLLYCGTGLSDTSNYNSGIRVENTVGTIITGNHIEKSGYKPDGTDGLMNGLDIECVRGTQDTVIAENTLVGARKGSINIEMSVGDRKIKNVRIVNNTIKNSTYGVNIQSPGLATTEVADVKILDNHIELTGATHRTHGTACGILTEISPISALTKYSLQITGNTVVGLGKTSSQYGIAMSFGANDFTSTSLVSDNILRGLEYGLASFRFFTNQTDYLPHRALGTTVRWERNRIVSCGNALFTQVNANGRLNLVEDNNIYEDCTAVTISQTLNSWHVAYEGRCTGRDSSGNLLVEFKADGIPNGVGAAEQYYQGDRIINPAPSLGGQRGWVCTASGTPGTWATFGTIVGITALANDATPTVAGGSTFTTGGTTTITDFDDGDLGQTITVLSEHAVTITDGTNIILHGSANFVMAAADSLTLVLKADNKWYETARMVN